MLQQDIQTLNAALAQLVQDETHFAADTQDDQSPNSSDRHAALRRRAFVVKAMEAERPSTNSPRHAARRGSDLAAVDNVFAGLGKLM
jgi:hypothetical protein